MTNDHFHRAGNGAEGALDRLPTAATCMNLLKLPPYRSCTESSDPLLQTILQGQRQFTSYPVSLMSLLGIPVSLMDLKLDGLLIFVFPASSRVDM
ncbi:hypothetical protein FF2_021503 [Malus domestica]